MRYLAFDLGAESGRAVVGEPRDGVMHMQEVHRFANGGVRAGKHLRWDALGLWREIKHGMRAAGQTGRIDSIGICTWGVDYGLLDQHDELLGNPFTYRDARTDGLMALAQQRIGREKIFMNSGIQFMQINTLYQLMAERAHNAQVLGLARRFLMMPDLFHFWMTGEAANEHSNASTTQLLDMATGQWSHTLLDAIDIPQQLFSPPLQPGALLGHLRKDVAEESGLHAAQVCVVGTHDTASAVAAVTLGGQASAHSAYISSGTWSLVGVTLDAPLINADTLRYNMTNEGGVFGKVRLLKNVMGLWLIQQCRGEWARAGQVYDYETLTRLAAESQFTGGFDASDESLLHPESMVSAVQALAAAGGQPAPHSVADVTRCVLNALAQTYARVLRELESVTATRIEHVHIVGGGARNSLLNKLTAQASGKRVIAGEVEATALGNLLVQATALTRTL